MILKRNYLFCILIILLLLESCSLGTRNNKNVESVDNEYTFISSRIPVYENEYNEDTLLLQSKIKTITKNDYGESIELSREVYSYDTHKKLVKKEYYDLSSENQEKLTSIKLYSDKKNETLVFSCYPKDTLYYSYRINNDSGKVVTEYSKDNHLDFKSEKLSEYLYDQSGRLIIIKSKYLLDNKLLEQI